MRVEIIDKRKQRFNDETFYRNKHGYFIHNGQPLQRAVWTFHNGDIPKGYDIHHIDFDKDNNQIENLVCVTRAEHKKLHHPPRISICAVCGKSFEGSGRALSAEKFSR